MASSAGGESVVNAAETTQRGDWSDEYVNKVASVWELKDKEIADLKQLGEKLSDIQHWKNDPKHVVFFLKARPKKIGDAEVMFRKMIEWRREHGADTILQDYQVPQLLKTYYPYAVMKGVAKNGAPLIVERIGSVETVKLTLAMGKEELYRHGIWIREMSTNGPWVKEYEEKYGRPFGPVLYVQDLEGISMSKNFSQKAFSMVEPIAKMNNENYPELPYKIIIVRAPTIFRMLWAAVKYFFEARQRELMEFCGNHNFKEVLGKHVDLTFLPPEIVPDGKGEVVDGFDCGVFKGGPMPEQKDDDTKQKYNSSRES